MGLPAFDFSAYLRAIIQAGQVVEESNVVEIVSDTGLVVGHATYEIVQSNNGVAQEVAVATTAGGTGVAAYTTGLAYMAVDVSVVGAALAPALGVLAGVGLYNLAPEFWTNVSNALVNAGKTIGGKVIAYWNGDNIYFDEETIEIFEDELIAVGAFEHGAELPEYEPAPVTGIRVESNVSVKDMFYYALSKIPNAVNITSEAKAQLSDILSDYNDYTSLMQMNPYSGYPQPTYGGVLQINPPEEYVSTSRPEISYIISIGRRFVDGVTEIVDVSINGPHTYMSNFTDYFQGEYVDGSGNICASSINGTVINNENLQEGAVYPDGRPIPNIYPGWLPWEYPVTIPSTELPTVYPVKYPQTDPDPYPTQEPAQNPRPEPVPVIIPIITPEFPLPSPTPDPQPYPVPTPDPDPQPEPEPVPEPIEPTPQPDPIDPNPDPTPSPGIPVVPLPSTVSSNKLFTVYNPTSSQLDQLGGFLWNNSIIETIRKIWQNPLDGVISLIQIYATPPTSRTQNIILGLLDSGVPSSVVSNQFVTVDCGSVSVPENKFNATDYAPYTSLHLFLPFVGIVELDTAECMNSTISVKYKVDVYTGTCLAEVKVVRNVDMPNGPILYTYSGNCSQQIPLTSSDASGLLSAILGGVTAGLSVASGGSLGVVAGANLVGNSLTHDMVHVSHSGNLSANAGIMGQKKPYLIIGRRHCYDANNYNTYYGYPANKTVVIGNCSGFIKVKKCFVKTSAMESEHDLIMDLLKDGVIV